MACGAIALVVLQSVGGCGSSHPTVSTSRPATAGGTSQGALSSEYPDAIVWVKSHAAYVVSVPGGTARRLAVPDPTVAAWGQSGREVALISGSGAPRVWIYDLAAKSLRSVPCPVAYDPDYQQDGECSQGTRIGFVGSQLVVVDQDVESAAGEEVLYELTASTTWKRQAVLPSFQNTARDAGSASGISFSPRGVVQFVPTAGSDSGAFAAYLLTLDGRASYLAALTGPATSGDVAGRPIEGTSDMLVNTANGTGGYQGGSLLRLSLLTGQQIPVPLPQAPAGEFWDFDIEGASSGLVYAGLSAEPTSCEMDDSTCPDSPVTTWVLRGTEWQSTGVVTPSGSYESPDRTILIRGSALSGDTRSVSIFLDGNLVASNVDGEAVPYSSVS